MAKVGSRQHKVFKIFGTGVKPVSGDDRRSGEKRSFARPESHLWDEEGSRAKSADFDL